MVLTLLPDGLRKPDIVGKLDTGHCLVQTEAVSPQYLLVAARVQLSKALAELYFAAVYLDTAVGALVLLFYLGRYVVVVDAQEPAYPRPLEVKQSGGLVRLVYMHDVIMHLAEDP